LRIVGGIHRGRRLAVPRAPALRPTAERTREAVFDILEHAADVTAPSDAQVLDVFAGTGALGFEALSRGAQHLTFIEHDRACARRLRETAHALDEADKVVVLVCDAQHPPQPTANAAPATLAFFDAPYASGLTAPALTALRGHGWIASGTCCVVEMGAEEAFAAPPGFRLVDERAYGAARVLFLAAP
jgi:16S rRNA (guanine966-N2)-methyltransferase